LNGEETMPKDKDLKHLSGRAYRVAKIKKFVDQRKKAKQKAKKKK